MTVGMRWGASLLALAELVSGPAEARPMKAASADWLYVVKSESADPAREADYNRWYTTIDIPDVLDVPGFERARRAVASDRAEASRRAYAADGDYVALYDIRTAVIDKTIIDLYVGARRMTWRGRTTDLLKVTEANYYRSVWDQKAAWPGQGATSSVMLVKIKCCRTDAERTRVGRRLAGFASESIGRNPQLTRIALYDLYRVMEVEALPRSEVPHLMVVVEARTADAAVAWLAAAEATPAALDASLIADDTRTYSVFYTQQASRPR